jgi:transposase-like protein
MQRAEIITVERRRRWSLSDKQQIVAETLQPGASVSTIAQRYGMHPSQLFAGRKVARDGRLVEDSRGRVCSGRHCVGVAGARGVAATRSGIFVGPYGDRARQWSARHR